MYDGPAPTRSTLFEFRRELSPKNGYRAQSVRRKVWRRHLAATTTQRVALLLAALAAPMLSLVESEIAIGCSGNWQLVDDSEDGSREAS